MRTESLDLDPAPRPVDLRVIHEGLRAFTDGHAGPVNARPFAIFVRDHDGNVVGGLEGELRWTWLFIGYLWLPERLRVRGWGARSWPELKRMPRHRVALASISTRWNFNRSIFTSAADTASTAFWTDSRRGFV